MLSVSGADASGGNTRSHPEHDREEPDGRRYYAGDGMGVKSSNLSISIAVHDHSFMNCTLYLENCIQDQYPIRQ